MWLNYHHLYYFWRISEEGSITRAAEKLRLSQPTLSTQLKQLEDSLEVKLFERSGKRLHLTSDGQLVLRYANSIFSLGSELQSTLQGLTPSAELKLRVGVTVSLPKLITHKTLKSVHELSEPVKIECFEGKRENLLSDLGAHELDLVLADAPFTSEVAVKAFNHRLGYSGISLYAVPTLLKKYPGKEVQRFHDAPFVLPTKNTMIRRAVDTWLESHQITPRIIAEFEDSALLKTYGSEGYGFFPVASTIGQEVADHYGVSLAQDLEGAKEEFFAISLERKVSHPAIAAITRAAKNDLF